MVCQVVGPYEIIGEVGPVNYRVRQDGRRKETQIYYINLLKPWNTSQSSLVAKKTPECLVLVEATLSLDQKQEVVTVRPVSRCVLCHSEKDGQQ